MEDQSREESSSDSLNSVRKQVKKGGYIHLLLAAMTIPCIITWILSPAITKVKYEFVSERGPNTSLVYHGSIVGWRLIYPTKLLFYFFYVWYGSLQLINASERGSPRDLRILYKLAAKCLDKQRWILRWDKAQILVLTSVFLMDFGIILTEAFLVLMTNFGMWLLLRRALIEKLVRLVEELREARDAREVEVADALGNFRRRR